MHDIAGRTLASAMAAILAADMMLDEHPGHIVTP
jgi:isocitrate/isopropylmalate dehydrogenase